MLANVQAATETVGKSSHRDLLRLVPAAVLYFAAIILTWLGSADPPIDLRSSAFWYQVLSKVPGLLDVCGDFTWGARLVPALLALVGAAVAFLPEPRTQLTSSVGLGGVVLASVLAYATTQNAVPWGAPHCIIN